MEMCCTDERRKQCGHEKNKIKGIDMQVCVITKKKINEKNYCHVTTPQLHVSLNLI